jgi:hypothetical protein
MKIGPPSSMGANLTRLISETRALGAYPVLITSVSRRNFVNDTNIILDKLGPWAEGQPLIFLVLGCTRKRR